MPPVLGSVNLDILTNQLAQVSVATTRRPLALIGPAPSGQENTPTPYNRKSTLLAAHPHGPLAEAGAYALTYEVPQIVAVRTRVSDEVAGVYGSITVDSVDGTVTGDGTIKPGGDYEVVVEVLSGFTVGVTGGQYKYSLNGGGKFSGPIALGTALFIQLPLGGGKYNLTATDVWLAGESFSLVTTAPKWSTDGLTAAGVALRDTSTPFGFIEFLGPFATTGEIDAAHALILDMRSKAKWVRGMGHFRARNPGESVATYLAAFTALVGSVDKDLLGLTLSWYAPSAVNPGAEYVAPFCWAVAPRTAKLREDISANSRTEFGKLVGSIRDSSGQVRARAVDDFHDAGVFTAARGIAPSTWPDKPDSEVYVGAGSTLGADGSDTQFYRVAQVLDLAAETAYPKLADRVGRGLLPGADGLTLDPDEKKRIEGDVTKFLDQALVKSNKAVRARLVLDPAQQIVGTPPITLTGRALVRIKGYPDEFEVSVAVDITGQQA
jgi:hypothetical protein